MTGFLWKSVHRMPNSMLLWQRTMSLYNHTHGFEEKEIKKKLQQFTGGSVSLSKKEDGIGILTLNNPKLMNAFTGTMMIELQEKVAELENWEDGKGLIIHGAENTFCSGSDLNAVRLLSSPQARWNEYVYVHAKHLNQTYEVENFFKYTKSGTEIFAEFSKVASNFEWHVGLNPIVRHVEGMLPLITVALVQGKALGGGAELTTACDFRLMTPESEIRFVHKQMGLVPGWGGAARLVQILGSSLALKLLSGASKVQPEHALHIGLIDTILSPSDEPLEETCTWLKRHTKGPAEVIQAVKKVVVAGRELQLEAALRTEMKVFGTVWGGPVNLEALTQRTKHK